MGNGPWVRLTTELLSALSRHPGMTPRLTVVWLYLRTRANEAGEVWPSLTTVASDIGFCRSSVTECMAELTNLGLLQTVKAEDRKRTVRRVLTPTVECGPKTPTRPDSRPGRIHDQDETQLGRIHDQADTPTRPDSRTGVVVHPASEQIQGTDVQESNSLDARACARTYADPITPQVRELCRLAATEEPGAGAADALDKAIQEAHTGGATDADLRVAAIEYLSWSEAHGGTTNCHGLNRAILRAKDNAWRLRLRNGKQRVSRQIPTTHTEHAEREAAIAAGTLKSRWTEAVVRDPEDSPASET